jgi:superoxide dismutase, Cu-Zn family
MKASQVLLGVLALAVTPLALAERVIVPIHQVDERGVGLQIGEIALEDSHLGLVLRPVLRELPPGTRGFHVHEHPSCEPAERDGKPVAALAAGGHYDPEGTGRHDGPAGVGHLGDLPPLVVGSDGLVATPVVAPRLKLADVRGRSLMIHEGGDNYADEPEPLGGGGGRIACGVIPN